MGAQRFRGVGSRRSGLLRSDVLLLQTPLRKGGLAEPRVPCSQNKAERRPGRVATGPNACSIRGQDWRLDRGAHHSRSSEPRARPARETRGQQREREGRGGSLQLPSASKLAAPIPGTRPPAPGEGTFRRGRATRRPEPGEDGALAWDPGSGGRRSRPPPGVRIPLLGLVPAPAKAPGPGEPAPGGPR